MSFELEPSRSPRASDRPAIRPAVDAPSVWAIVASNVLTIIIALWQQWPLVLLLWPFWIQSIVIGWYNVRRIRALRQFSTEGFRINGREVEPNEATKRTTANFFVLHFGLFHLVYFVLLAGSTSAASVPDLAPMAAEAGVAASAVSARDLVMTLALGLSFVFTHRASFRRNLAADLRGRPNIGVVMFLPYARVIPMHMMVILGLVLDWRYGIVLFGALKTIADVVMHVVEHRVLARAS